MTKRVTITLTPTEEESINEIMKRYGFSTMSSAISLAVNDYINTRDFADSLTHHYLAMMSSDKDTDN